MAFYSTLPTSGLQDTFNRFKDKIAIEVIDGGRIEHYLLNEKTLDIVAMHYFERSYRDKRLKEANHDFQKEVITLEYEFKEKLEEGTRQRDALGLVQAEREYKRKVELAQRLRDLDIAYFKDE